MRKLLFGLVLALGLATPVAARAELILEGSVGKGGTVSPDKHWNATNLMLAPGLAFVGSIVRLQVGFLGEVPDVEGKKFDLQFRPMVTVKPPILPLHARAIFAVQNVLHDDVQFAYGGAAGLNLSVLGIGVFAEAGLLPASVKNEATQQRELNWIIEGRVGASLMF